jgi:ABC-2 type transport system ATP-binding protein
MDAKLEEATAAPEPEGRSGGGAAAVPALACRDLVYAFGVRTAVDHLSFEVRPGEAYGLLGPNGAGKTTTIRLVCGMLDPDAGGVEVCGRSLRGRGGRAARGLLRYVPQGLALFPTLTLAENLDFWARMYGIDRRARAGAVSRALELVELTGRADDRAERTSGGMQRRLNLAVALLDEAASLLVLDEPTVGVDAQSRAALIETIGGLRDQGMAVLYTSHYFDEVERLCDRVGIIDHGRLVLEGSPAEVVAGGDGTADLQDLFLAVTGRDLRE